MSSSVPTSSAQCDCNEILVVDDNDFNLMTFQAIMEAFGLSSNGAVNGLDALNKVKKQIKCCPLRLIFMDVNMPIMDGL